MNDFGKSNNDGVGAKRLYSIVELTRYIGATDWFWRTQIWEGHLPFIKVGKKMFVDVGDIEDFIASNKHQNGQ
ncbi:DNA-binding protein [Desulfogranum marinum]|uniref:DNA-binding protein n=1 Tax=Desulfogranum marinum TaxID=453220 RepID=UPI0019665D18|nr:DNA-binding protein [Desulfogranum marinum]MBM9514717.1 DNA-binding protein [Desulfogranum marinum]